MANGVDYSYDRPTVAELQAAGVSFVVRYVSTPGHAKNLTEGERRQLQAAGLDIAIVCQVTATDALAGWDRGVQRAKSAHQQVLDLGGPADSVIYFVVDFDATATQLPVCTKYIQGAASVLGHARTGVYGGLRTIVHMADRNVCRYYWQTYAWSSGQWDARAQLQQYKNNVRLGSGTVDWDRNLRADYGQWGGQREWWEQPLGPVELQQIQQAFTEALR